MVCPAAGQARGPRPGLREHLSIDSCACTPRSLEGLTAVLNIPTTDRITYSLVQRVSVTRGVRARGLQRLSHMASSEINKSVSSPRCPPHPCTLPLRSDNQFLFGSAEEPWCSVADMHVSHHSSPPCTAARPRIRVPTRIHPSLSERRASKAIAYTCPLPTSWLHAMRSNTHHLTDAALLSPRAGVTGPCCLWITFRGRRLQRGPWRTRRTRFSPPPRRL